MSENLQQQYDTYQTTLRSLGERLNTLSSQLQEHEVVLTTLKSVNEDRPAWRMLSGGESSLEAKAPVGAALVPMTAKDAAGQLEEISTGLKNLYEKTQSELQTLQKEFESWKKEKNIKIVRG